MSAHFAGWDRETLDLALAEFTTGLAAQERAALLARAAPEHLAEFEQAIADLNVAGLASIEAPPDALLRRIAADARAHFGRAS